MFTIIERARRYVAKCPPAISGQGGHNATLYVACVLAHGFDLTDGDALALLREWNGGCQPPWNEAEMVHKITSARTVAHRDVRGHLLKRGTRSAERGAGTANRRDFGGSPKPTGGAPVLPKAKFAAIDPVGVTKAFLKGFYCSEQDLTEASAVKMSDDWKQGGAVLVRSLYEAGERVNFVTEYQIFTERDGTVKAKPNGCGITLDRDALVARFKQHGSDMSEAGAWLRMNPLDGKGVADVNVTAFRFTLLESDILPIELQLPLLARLPLPIAAILGSGGKSVHAWVKVEAADFNGYRETVARLFELVARFGFDQKNKNSSRLSRLPGAKRSINAVGDGEQRLLYLNPQPEQRRILE